MSRILMLNKAETLLSQQKRPPDVLIRGPYIMLFYRRFR